jgi:hypothetical protein
VGAAQTPRWQAEVDANPQLMGRSEYLHPTRSSGAGPSRGAIAAAWSAAPATRAGQGGAAAAPAQPAPRGQPSPIGVGPPAGGAPQPRAATPAAPRPWSLSAAPAAPAIPAAGRRSDRAVVAPSTDHLRQRVPRRSHSSEATTDLLAPTGSRRQRSLTRPARWPAPRIPASCMNAFAHPSGCGELAGRYRNQHPNPQLTRHVTVSASYGMAANAEADRQAGSAEICKRAWWRLLS